MSVARWVLAEPATGQTVTLPINPNQMSTPTTPRPVQYASGHRAADVEQMRAFASAPSNPTRWTFHGVISTKEHYDLLLTWAQKSSVLHVTDHLQRTFEIIIARYDPVERLPTATKSWRADYTMECLLLGVVS
jgi:hypothetical protein